MNEIKVSVVEDNAAFCRTLATLFRVTPDIELLSSYGSAEEALRGLPDDKPDVVLMDIRLPGMSGIECVRALREKRPGVRVIMLTAYEEDEDIFLSLTAGAQGYLLKGAEPETILDAIREVHTGGSLMTGRIARKIVAFFQKAGAPASPESKLSEREDEVLRRIAEGAPYKQIAADMKLSVRTVRTYAERIFQKMQVHSRSEAVAKYLSQGRLSVRG
ncbi:MAG: response regulator transcription factor [bacterium]